MQIVSHAKRLTRTGRGRVCRGRVVPSDLVWRRLPAAVDQSAGRARALRRGAWPKNSRGPMPRTETRAADQRAAVRRAPCLRRATS